MVLGFNACLPVSQASRYSPTVMLVMLTSVMRDRTTCWSAACAAALVGNPALLVCRRRPLLSRPYSSTHCQVPLHRWGAYEPSSARGQLRVWRCETDPCFIGKLPPARAKAVSYTHLRAHETVLDLVC